MTNIYSFLRNTNQNQNQKKIFDPDGDGYDEQTYNELIRKMPLTIPKPNRKGKKDRETIKQKSAFQSWVWHEDKNDWFKHGGSFDPRTGMLLKGYKHKTMYLTIQEENKLNNKIEKKEDGRYYTIKKEK